MQGYYSINDLTREFSISARTLRYYEEEGLLIPFRRGYKRLYTQTDRYKLKQILRARRVNFSLSEISNILTMDRKPPDNEKKLKELIAGVNKKRADLQQMRCDIDDLLHDLERIEETFFESLAELGVNR
ncbi:MULTISPECIES: MerR family transcriptional regulator [unclassified Bartonella]|uniref:MerR family transcriptional regulator n=1 Tax=unclassified Bartonella TaxID=2645622 RepID=UPI000999B474|nr:MULTISPECIES: MerR family DNA-binding transcriptional regulator [unclassified Bartonella]AQX28144.1 DNA-binding transcriptional regulator, MerR family [Bartonella sp. JB15]AQX29414.1 DNA-binding transcriptional regulator, MerR family [Bartonella sp. JB63]